MIVICKNCGYQIERQKEDLMYKQCIECKEYGFIIPAHSYEENENPIKPSFGYLNRINRR